MWFLSGTLNFNSLKLRGCCAAALLSERVEPAFVESLLFGRLICERHEAIVFFDAAAEFDRDRSQLVETKNTQSHFVARFPLFETGVEGGERDAPAVERDDLIVEGDALIVGGRSRRDARDDEAVAVL